MANEEHVERIKQGVKSWNSWRAAHPRIRPALSGADLSNERLRGINFREADLSSANLSDASLVGADLTECSLSEANLSDANLEGATLIKSDLRGAVVFGVNLALAKLTSATIGNTEFKFVYLDSADLSEAFMAHTRFHETSFRDARIVASSLQFSIFDECVLVGANLTGSRFQHTIFAESDLSNVIGLETCLHVTPSVIDFQTLLRSKNLPLHFLRGVGLPDGLIDYLPSLFDDAIRHYSAFVSYSTKDQDMADRIYADLQDNGIRCWFAPHNMRIGDKILDTIDEAIRLRDKVLLVLSEHSIRSDWVEDEVTKAFEEERKRGQTVLFPIRLDDAVMETNEAWAAKLRARHIGDFRRWKEHDEYQKSFARVLRDLTVKQE